MDIIIDPSLQAYIDPLTADEHAALERSILAEGCRDALVLWGNVLVDGHNRYGICREHGLPFRTEQNARFASIDDVHLWMIDQHLGRRSVSDFQRGVLALRKRELLAKRRTEAQPQETAPASAEPLAAAAGERPPALDPPALPSRAELARAARLSQAQVGLIEKIQQRAAPGVIAAVRAGELSINAAAAVASLPEDEQSAAVRGGRDELKQAARRVRATRSRPIKPPAPPLATPLEAPAQAQDERAASTLQELEHLRQRVATLTAENLALREELASLRASLA